MPRLFSEPSITIGTFGPLFFRRPFTISLHALRTHVHVIGASVDSTV